eukprot:2899182-Heterocapsa_arctica.AAC.1
MQGAQLTFGNENMCFVSLAPAEWVAHLLKTPRTNKTSLTSLLNPFKSALKGQSALPRALLRAMADAAHHEGPVA